MFQRKVVRASLAAAAAAAVATLAGGAGVVSGGGVASAASSKAPITIAMITSVTGPAASEFASSPAGFKARIALQNAQGGVNGHKIVGMVIDDQTTNVVTAVQDALSKGALGIVSVSPLFFQAAKYPNQQGVPVTGGSFDGPEWGTQPYTNMFASDTGSVNTTYPVNKAIGNFLVAHGGNRIGTYANGVSPSSIRSAVGAASSMIHAGGKQAVLDTSVSFGGVDFTTAALVAKQKNVNALYAGLTDQSNFALATSLKQAGVKLKAVVLPTGYEPSVVKSPVWQSLQGYYFYSEFRPFSVPNAGTQQMSAALQKYEDFSKSQFPAFSQYEAWLGADLMIKGIQLAGPNPTQAAVIKELRGLKSYNGNGILPNPINYSTIFGKDMPQSCGWYLLADKNGFAPTSPNAFCGRDIPGTTTVTK
jgi:branched-chain amino acid transport system substrate-binding protein